MLRGCWEQGLSYSTAETSQPGLLAEGGLCLAGSVALLQPPSPKAEPPREAIHGAKAVTPPLLCGSDAKGHASRSQQQSEEPLQTLGSKKGTLAAKPALSPWRVNAHLFPRVNKQEHTSQLPPSPQQ